MGIKLRQCWISSRDCHSPQSFHRDWFIKVGFTKIKKPAVPGAFQHTEALYYAQFIGNVKFLDP